MNNTKSILLAAIITATLIMGTSVIPMQSYADRDNNDDHKKDKDFKSKIISGSESDKKSASQHQDQDNFCYRGDDCEQANQGQQIVGKDNDAKGFNDQSRSLQSTPATTGAAGGTGNNGNGTTPTPPPTTGTLNVCKVVNNGPGLNFEPSDFTFTFTSEGANPAEFAGSADCTAVTVPEGPYSFGETLDALALFTTTASGDCTQDSRFIPAFHGSINAGDTQTCTVTNNIGIRTPI